jgi:transcriptional regulator with XRE-family HTH domain
MDDSDVKRQAIANRLKVAREWAGLTQNQVAKKLGLHRPSVSEIEAGRRGVSAEEIAAMAKLYKVGVDWLVGTEDSNSVRDRLQLAARELSKLRKEDLDRLLDLLGSLRQDRG